MAYVRVKKGTNPGEVFEIGPGPLRIGRDEGQNIRVTDDGVSRAHAEIFIMGGAGYVRDLDSTNGTFLNGEQIREEELSPGDEVQVGETVLVFEGRAL